VGTAAAASRLLRFAIISQPLKQQILKKKNEFFLHNAYIYIYVLIFKKKFTHVKKHYLL
jgi:hypothetical protein